MPNIMTEPRSVLYRGNRDDLNELCREKDNRIAQLEAALLLVVQEDNGCVDRFGGWVDNSTRRMAHAPCGKSGGIWGAEKCGCAIEAANRVK